MLPSVYIIVLNWNNCRDTLICLNSLEKLNYPNYRLLVVDNGSDDDSVVCIRGAYPNLELIETGRNLGFAGGNNVGIRYALERGADYVWLLNNDTKVDPRALTAMVEAAESDSRIGAVGSVLYYMDEPERMQAWGGGWVSLLSGVTGHYKGPVDHGKLDYITGASLLIRASTLREVGYLDERYFMYWEDVDLCFRIRRQGWKLAVADQSFVFHREGATKGKGLNSKRIGWMYEGAAIFLSKYAPTPLISLAIGMGGRFVKSLLRGDWLNACRAIKYSITYGLRH